MTTLTQNQLTELQLHVEAGDRIAYYETLRSWNFTYGGLALGVVLNDTVAGSTANQFMQNRAIADGWDPSPDDWAQIGITLMQLDFIERQEANGAVLEVVDILDYHAQAFAAVSNLSPDVTRFWWAPTFDIDTYLDDEDKQEAWLTWYNTTLPLIFPTLYLDAKYLILLSEELNSPFSLTPEEYRYLQWYPSAFAAANQGLLTSSNSFGNYDISLNGAGRLLGGDENANDLDGTSGNDVLMGFDGGDLLNGLDGDDRLYGGPGLDVLLGGEDDDLLDGREDEDTLLGEGGNDRLYGGDGFDYLDGGEDGDFLFGGEGDDQLFANQQFLNGIPSSSDLYVDVLFGDGGNDTLISDGGGDLLFGGSGNDSFFVPLRQENSPSPEIIIGGAGIDRVYFEGITGPAEPTTSLRELTIGILVVNVPNASMEQLLDFDVTDLGLADRLDMSFIDAVVINPDSSDRIVINASPEALEGASGDSFIMYADFDQSWTDTIQGPFYNLDYEMHDSNIFFDRESPESDPFFSSLCLVAPNSI